MNICFIIGTLNYSGAEKIARYLIEQMHYHYHYNMSVILVSGQKISSGDMGYVKQYLIEKKHNKIIDVICRQRQIRTIVTQGRFDVVVSFGVKYNLDVMEALKHTKARVILCERNDPVNDPHRLILRIRRKLCYKYASGYVFQTDKIADFFGGKIKSRGTVIPNFIEKKQEVFYSSSTGNNIVVTARLDDVQKNISMLLQAFSEFSKEYDYMLYIVGNGPDEKKFKDLAAELGVSNKVVFTGRKNVYDYLKHAQIYVLPSNYEGMPNSLIEAMSVGIPCIATDCSGGGSAYLIDDHVNGTLIPVQSKDRLVCALKELADDPILREKYSVEAYKINEKLCFDTIIGQWIAYIEKVGGKVS